MILLTGPAGSGKTHYVLERLRGALRIQDSGVRLLVPTATMVRHVRNQMAREGFVFRPELILTLSRFIDPWVEDVPLISEPLFYLLVEKVLQQAGRTEFARVARFPGFCAALARTLDEFSASGCDARQLARVLPSTPLGGAFLAIYKDVERELESRGLAMRSGRLARAAARIEQQGLGPVKTVWMDGFFSLTDPELGVAAAIAKHAGITVTLPLGKITAATKARLLSMGFENLETTWRGHRAWPTVFEAPSIEREADEIARRILQSGRAFREIGIIVRNPDLYVPILRATLERFGIPAHFYFDLDLSQHALIRYLGGVMDAMLAGWEHAQTVAAMRMAVSGAGVTSAMDWFEFQVREKLPDRGLDALRGLASDDRISGLLEKFAALDSWRLLLLNPVQWTARFKTLRSLFRAPRPWDSPTYEDAAGWRGQAQAWRMFEAAIEEAAQFMEPSAPVSLAHFWKTAKAVLRLTPLRIEDARRNVVHVLSAYEARQWELPVVFVCGLVEKQFPRQPFQEPFFPDVSRRQLKNAGLRVRSAEDSEIEEEFLFDSAVDRATASLVLSYPRCDGRGERNLPSLFLQRFAMQPEVPEPVQPAPLRQRTGWKMPPRIYSADLLKVLSEQHAVMKPTPLECFVQCPFQFFASHTLKLKAAPVKPEERLDFRVQGAIVHQVLAQWHRDRQALEPLFDRVFDENRQRERIPAGLRTELLRQSMLQDLRRFVSQCAPPNGNETLTEEDFQITLANSLTIRGRVDRLDKTPSGRGVLIDYKYSATIHDRVKKDKYLQGPLYLLALEQHFGLEAAGMFYCGLKGDVKYAGWGEALSLFSVKAEPLKREWLNNAIEVSVRAAAEIQQGTIAPRPLELDPCRYCEFRDVCRYETGAREGVVSVASRLP